MRQITASLLAAALLAVPASAAIHLDLDFASAPYSAGALVGQDGWTQSGASATSPLSIVDGRVVMPNTSPKADDQDAVKAFSVSTVADSAVVYGLRLRVTGPGGNGAGFDSSYIAALNTNDPFANMRLAVRSDDGTNFVFRARLNGQGSNPYTDLGSSQPFGATEYTVFLSYEWQDSGNGGLDVLRGWVNPADASALPSLTQVNGGAANTNGFGGFLLSQFSFSPGVEISGLVVADTLGEAIGALVPEPSTWALLVGVAGLAVAAIRRRRA